MSGKKYRVLLVEDDLVSQRFIVTLLESLGCEVLHAVGEKDSLKLLTKPCDLILMDLGLEDTDGFTLTNKIKALGSVFLEIPVIGITANLTDLYRAKAKECKMAEIVEKPLRSIDLQRMIHIYLN